MQWGNTIDIHVLQAFDLNEAKSSIQAYVESRMSFIAPNLSIIVGSSTAAKIMGKSSLLKALSTWIRYQKFPFFIN